MPLSVPRELLAGSFDFHEDIIGLGSPDKRSGISVVGLEILLQCGDQFWQTMKDAAPQAFDREVSEEALHHIEPRSAGRSEMQVEAWMLGQPRFDLGVLMRRVVIQDQMQLSIWLRLPIDELEKLQPFLMPVSRLALADDLAVGYI